MSWNYESPTRSIFNPFAPSTEDLLFLTLPKKKMRKLSINVGDGSEKNLQTSLKRAPQREASLGNCSFDSIWFDLSAKNLLENFNEPEAFKTPEFLPLLKVFSNIIPDENPPEVFNAPMRDFNLPLTLRNNIQRKLDF